MKSGFLAYFGYRYWILEVKKRKIIRILLGIHFWGLNCTIVDLKCLKFDNNKEEEEEKEDNNDREEEEDNNNKEDNDIKEEEEALRAKRRPEGPHTRSWGPEGPWTSSAMYFPYVEDICAIHKHYGFGN